ncbi:innexin shaking-B [Parasteatoda tepidariorum]|uniref:innexin shaking-B n=1 Tax=Parasteatoda tepidariorum TaxID=114398 RepID=UPI001C722A42|nr:innexin shaking-B-like [Parasteatoda tepidariorum]
MMKRIINYRIRYQNSPVRCSFVFRVSALWTPSVLLFFSLIVSSRLAFGDSFSCLAPPDVIPQSYLEVKCYSESVYVIPTTLFGRERGYSSMSQPSDNFLKYQSFYKWVNLMFLLQAFVFSLPYFVWKTYVSSCSAILLERCESYEKEQKNSYLNRFVSYLLLSRGKHKLFTFLYVILEICNFGISVGQLILLVNFFQANGNTTTEVFLPVGSLTWSEYREIYFPTSGMCKFFKYSASGDRIHFEAVCILPLNHLFMILFFITRLWYVCLSILTALALIYRLVSIPRTVRINILKSVDTLSKRSTLQMICKEFSYSDWFFLVNGTNFSDFDYCCLHEKLVVAMRSKIMPYFKENENGSLILEVPKEEEKSIIISDL